MACAHCDIRDNILITKYAINTYTTYIYIPQTIYPHYAGWQVHIVALLPKVDSTNDDTQDSIFESNQAAAAKAGNATGMNRAETKPNKNKGKLKQY